MKNTLFEIACAMIVHFPVDQHWIFNKRMSLPPDIHREDFETKQGAQLAVLHYLSTPALGRSKHLIRLA